MPVSMVGHQLPVFGVTRVGPVYTPAEHRRHGYAGALTAHVTGGILDRGDQACLYTDLANPTVEQDLRPVGYVPVADFVDLGGPAVATQPISTESPGGTLRKGRRRSPSQRLHHALADRAQPGPSWMPIVCSAATARVYSTASAAARTTGRRDRHQVGVHRAVGPGPRVARVVDRVLDQVADVLARNPQLRQDDRVVVAIGTDREAGRLEGLAALDHRDPLGQPRCRCRQLRGDAGVGPDRHVQTRVTRSTSRWSKCSWVTRIASTPSNASSSAKMPGSTSSTLPSFSSRTQACVYLVSFTDQSPSASLIGTSLAFVSASSASGSDPATMPAPANSRIRVGSLRIGLAAAQRDAPLAVAGGVHPADRTG